MPGHLTCFKYPRRKRESTYFVTPAVIHPGTLQKRYRRNAEDVFPSDHNIFHMLQQWRRGELVG